MKTFLRHLVGLGLLVTLACATQSTQATVIDFNDIPDGTPVSAGNPYAGVLVLEAQTGWAPLPFLFPDDYPFPPEVWVWFPSKVFNGEIVVREQAGDYPPPASPPVWSTYFEWNGSLKATFLQPVADVSLEVRHAGSHRSYSYAGTNGKGEVFATGGQFMDPLELSPTKLDFQLPPGFYLTEFTVYSYDTIGAFHDFEVDNIAFTVLSVPDGGTSAVLLMLSCVGVSVVRRLLSHSGCSRRILARVGLGLLVTLACATQSTQATVIDFNDIPDGTPVSAGNPYAGVVVLEAQTGWAPLPWWAPLPSLFPDDYPFPPGVWVWFPSKVFNGEIVVREQAGEDPPPPSPPVPPMWSTHFEWNGSLKATFLQPVADVSLEVRHVGSHRSYSYAGTNGKGEVFATGGQFGDPLELSPTKLDLQLPPGFFLTEFTVYSYDTIGTFHDFTVDNIAFTVLSVPDGGTSAVLLLLGFVALSAVRRLGGRPGYAMN